MAAITDIPLGVVRRVPSTARTLVDPTGLSRVLPRLLADIRTMRDACLAMAEGVAVLPDVADRLTEIEAKVREMTDEVAGMHSDVGGLDLRIRELHEDLKPIGRVAGRLSRRDRKAVVDPPAAELPVHDAE